MSYKAYVESVLRYGSVMWGNSTAVDRAFASQKVYQCNVWIAN